MWAKALSWPLLAIAVASCGGDRPGRDAVPPGSRGIHCVNTVSGAAWDIAIDEARGLADGRRAQMSAGGIAWRDPADNGGYNLDRASGALSVTRASSTGGYIMTYQCAAVAIAEKPGS